MLGRQERKYWFSKKEVLKALGLKQGREEAFGIVGSVEQDGVECLEVFFEKNLSTKDGVK